MTNKAIKFEEQDKQFVSIDIKRDEISLKNKFIHNKEDNNHTYQNIIFSQEDASKDQIYIKQVIDGEDTYVNLPKDIVKVITTDDLADFTARGCDYNEDNLQQSNNQLYDIAFNDYVPVEENLYEDFNNFRMHDFESVKINTDRRNKKYAFTNMANEFDSFKAIWSEKLNNSEVILVKSYDKLASIGDVHDYHNILPEYDVNTTKQEYGIHNFVANAYSRHNIDVNAIDKTNADYFEYKLDASDTKVFNVYRNIGNLAFDETDSVKSEIMMNEKSNGTVKSANKPADEKSLICDDNSLKKHSDENVNSNYDEIKYRFKGPVFRSFCEKKRKKNWKRRSLGGELKLVVKV